MCSALAELTIKTPRLLLRRVQPGDAARIAELIGDAAVSRNLVRVPHPYALADADDFVATVNAPSSNERVFAVVLPDDGLVGVVGLHVRDGSPLPELGYWLGRGWWGRGLATEAAAAAVDWAHAGWGKRALVSAHFADNAASARVLDKLGFLYTGEVAERRSPARGADVKTRMMVRLA